MEEQQKEIMQCSDDTSVLAGHRPVAVCEDRRRLLINLLVLAVTIPALLRCSGAADLLPATWSLSLFAVSYLFYCTCSFSATGTPLANIFTTLFHVGLLAVFTRSLISNVLGMVIMYLDSVLAAGLFGRTLAQHRQSDGTETAALVAVANARAKPESRRPVYVLIGFMALCYAPRLVWLILIDSPAIDVAVSFFGAIGFLQLIHISCVLGWLNGAVVDADSCAVIFYFALVFYLFVGAYLLMGEVAGVTVLWLCILASTAFLGYYHQVHASYEEIMSNRAPATTEAPQPQLEILVVAESSLVGCSATNQFSRESLSSSEVCVCDYNAT